MTIMKTLAVAALCAPWLPCTGQAPARNETITTGRATVRVTNPAQFARTREIVQVDETALMRCIGAPSFVLRDAAGHEVPWQATYDGLIVFPVTLAPGETAEYTAEAGVPSPVATVACGRRFGERLDDLGWENDLMAYRAYGPALQKSGERAFGYDVWTKSVPWPVFEKRVYGDKTLGISFHKDHGEGMDVYAVGPTLGGGTAALLDGEGGIIYPWCYTDYVILDRGPLRFTVRLHYPAGTGEGGRGYDETRLITLDAHDPFNVTEVTYRGLDGDRTAVAGQVVHKPNETGYVLLPELNGTAYADLTQEPAGDNGTIYVGMLSLDGAEPGYIPLESPAGDAVGHTVLRETVRDGRPLKYLWGAAWSKAGTPDMDAWVRTLAHRRACLDNPLRVEVSGQRSE